MLKSYIYNGVYFTDLVNPTYSELNKLQKAFDIDSATVAELTSPSLKPRVDVFENYVYLVLHFPQHTHDHDDSKSDVEIDFIIGDGFLVTARYSNGKQHIFDQIAKQIKQDPSSHASQADRVGKQHALALFKFLTDTLYQDTQNQLDKIKKELKNIEKKIFKHKEKQMVHAISIVARDIINMRQTLEPHQDVWDSLVKASFDFCGPSCQTIARSAEDSYYKIQKHLQNLWEILKELRETNNTMLSTKQNEVMKIFTILAFVTFPLSLFASLFGMNTKYTPLLGIPYDFWVIVALMSGATVLMFMYFKYKDWI